MRPVRYFICLRKGHINIDLLGDEFIRGSKQRSQFMERLLVRTDYSICETSCSSCSLFCSFIHLT